MCGIAGIFRNPQNRKKFPVSALSEALLLSIEKRGTHATGFLSVTPNPATQKPRLTLRKADIKASEFVVKHKIDDSAQTVLLHTRYWTKGLPTNMSNNHPVMLNSCFVTHNGSINNDDEIIDKAGLKESRAGEVDSFAILAALDHHGWADAKDIKASLEMLKGSFAFAAVDPVKRPGTLLLAKGDSSPLHILTTPQGVFWASVEDGLKDAWGTLVGTPPTHKAFKPGDNGWSELRPGQYWLVNTVKGKLVTTAGKFDVNRAWAGNTNHNHNSHVTYVSKDWTCWPLGNPKNCVFGQDCGHCADGECQCYEDNLNHPKLNKDIKSFKEAISKWPGFKRHCESFKLVEEDVSRIANPTSSTTTKSPGSALGHFGIVGAKNEATLAQGDVITKCFYCGKMNAQKWMRRVGVDTHNGAVYKCEKCDSIDKDRVEDGEAGVKHSPALAASISRHMAEALTANEVIEAALAQTAWEHTVDVELVRYCTLYQPTITDDADYADFQAIVKDGFRENIRFIKELKALEPND